MPTPVMCCGLECGTFDANLGLHWTTSTGATFDTTTHRTGARSLRVNPSAGVRRASSVYQFTGNLAIARFYLNISTAPNADVEVATVPTAVAGTGHRLGLWYKNSDGKYYVGESIVGFGVFFASSGISISTGAWHLVDLIINLSANPWTVDAKVDGTSLTQYSTALASQNIGNNNLVLGNVLNNATFDFYYDDVVLSVTSADYPMGAGTIEAFSPASDGTHSVTSTNFIKGSAGATITTSTTDSYLLVDDVPLGLTADDFINQQTASSAQYTENKFATTLNSSAPWGLDVMVGYHEQSTNACNSTIKLNDNGTEDTIVAQSSNGVTSIRFATKAYATMVGGGAWTLARFNNLRVRFGYSSDATPDVYFDCAMIEAAFPQPGSRTLQLNQAVKRGSFF